jgi:hypothetical protein
MKGKLTKTENGWVVNYNYSVNKNDWETLPLHPDFIELMDTCFTSKFTQDVEFEIVNTLWGVNDAIVSYAKLIIHTVESNEMIQFPKQEKDINYWKNNCEEDYMTTPISVLRYISELEKLVALPKKEICIDCDEEKETHEICMDCIGKMIKENQQELSDEEINKGGENAWSDYEYQEGNLYSTTFRDGWLMAIRWYREQLKNK